MAFACNISVKILLQLLIAKSASPKVDPNNVKLAFSKPVVAKIAPDTPLEVPKAEDSGNPWYAAAAVLGIILILGLLFIWNRATSAARKQQKQISHLQEIATNQEQQLRATQNQAAQIHSHQEVITKTVQELQTIPAQLPGQQNLSNTLAELRDALEESEDEVEVAHQLRSWIESGN